MKLSCEIVEDLLPLYLDEVCSDKSREAVEEHLKSCETCRKQIGSKELPNIPQIEPKREEQVLKKSMVKIRQRWWLSIIAMIMILPVILLGSLAVHEKWGEGVAFSNLRELWECRGFMKALSAGDGEKAASYIDFSSYYEECREALAMTPEDHMPEITIVLSDDEHGQWVFETSVYEDYTTVEDDSSTYDVTAIWYAALRQNDPRIMIPAEAFETMVGEQDTLSLEGRGYRLPNGICYLPYEAETGVYMVHEEAWELLKAPDTLLPDVIANIPGELYREMSLLLSSRAEQWCRNTRERLAQVADLNREEFCAYMQQWYGAKLNRYMEQGFSVEKYSYGTAYTSARGWDMVFYGTEEEKGGQNRIRFVFSLDKNRICGLYAMSVEESAENYDFLSPRIG